MISLSLYREDKSERMSKQMKFTYMISDCLTVKYFCNFEMYRNKVLMGITNNLRKLKRNQILHTDQAMFFVVLEISIATKLRAIHKRHCTSQNSQISFYSSNDVLDKVYTFPCVPNKQPYYGSC